MAFRVGQVVDGYRIVSELGRGGNGVVFLAASVDDGRKVAVKVPWLKRIRSSFSNLDSFLRETSAISRLQHPNIARQLRVGIYESKDDRGAQEFPYFMMEYIEGAPATELREISIRRIVEIMGKVCEAIHYAHCNRVIHCDLKPTNILIDTGGVPKVLDFGLAKLLDEIQSASGIFEGTPSYAAPEQFEGKTDERTDIWTLGAILFDLLTGRPPFVAENWERLSEMQQLFASQEMVLKKNTPSLCKINSAVDSYLEEICIRAMKKDPGARYQSAEDFAAALKKWGRVNRDLWLAKSQRLTSFAGLLPTVLRNTLIKKARLHLETALSYATATTPLKENLLKILKLEGKPKATIAELSLPGDMNAKQWENLEESISAVREMDSDYLLPIVDVFAGLRQGEQAPGQILLAYSCPKGKNLREVMGNVNSQVAFKLARAAAELEFYAREGLIIGLPKAREIFVEPLQMMVISWPISKERELNAFNLATLLYQMLSGRAFEGKVNEEKLPRRFQETLKSALLGNGGIKSAEDFINALEYNQQAEKILNAGVLDRPFALPPGEYNLKNKLLIEKNGHLKVQSNTIFYIDPGVAIECHGQITASGLWDAETEQGDIWFLPVDIKKGWSGIRFFDDVPQDKLQHFEGCVFQGGRGTPGENGICGGAIHMEGGLLKIVGSRFQENKVEGDGGAVYLATKGKNEMEMELKHSVFVENQSGGRGGAIASHASGEQRLHKCHFENNRAKEDGGSLYIRGRAANPLKIYLQKCTFLENRARIAGGAFSNGPYSSIHTLNCDYRRNIAGDNGGAVASVGKEGFFGELHFHDCRFVANRCEMRGGAVLARSYGKVVFEDCRFESNRAEDSAGAVKIVGSDKKPISAGFYRSVFSENRCQGHAGGIQAEHTRLSLEDCVFERNRCREAGGAVQLRGSGVYSEAKFCGVKFSENRSQQAAGAVDFRSFTRAKLKDCDFVSNCAEGKCGGALQIKGQQGKPGEITLAQVSFLENSCKIDGGALFADDYSLVLATDGRFEGNSAENGGAIAITGDDGKSPSKATMRKIIFEGNSCRADGGAISASQHIRLILDDCEFKGNEAKGNCGGIGIIGASKGPPSKAKFRNVSFVGNHCEIDGGAIAAGMHTQTIFEQCAFESNWAKGSCGAIGLAGRDNRSLSEATFKQVRFVANYCEIDGGAMVIGRYSRTKFEQCLWRENYAKQKTGGAILLLGKDQQATFADFYDCEFIKNQCGIDGGAVNANIYSQTSFEGCRFEENKACTKNGGAVVLLGKDARYYTMATFKDVVFTKNQCKISGGAINANDYTRSSFIDCVFEENKAMNKNGGAVLVLGETGQAPSETQFCKVHFKSNFCKGSGGAVNANIYTISSFLECRFDSNVADDNGGAIFIRGLRRLPNKATVKKSHFVGNIAGNTGADVALKAVKGVTEQSLLHDNTIDIPAPDFLAEDIEDEY